MAGQDFKSWTKTVLFLLWTISICHAAEQRRDLPDIFESYYVLKPSDFDLEYTVGQGRAVYTIKDAFGTTFALRMFEELSVFDTEPNTEIEMCNGTVTDEQTGEEGQTYGSIDKTTEIFRGQFVLNRGRTTYYVEDASDFLDIDESRNEDVVSILYSSEDVIKEAGAFEPEIMPVSNDRIDNTVWNDYNQDVNKIRNIMYQHVMTANRIFGAHFKASGRPQVKFVIGRLAIATDSYCKRNPYNIHCHRTVRGASDFLNQFSKHNFQKYCLSYMFTGRNFGSTLGVAYVGGVCDARSSYGYNCGFVIQSQRRSQFQTDLTFAHEVGHNFGASHDSSGSCLGNSRSGTFLMSPYASNKDQPNNSKFSTCSVSYINQIFAKMASGRKTNCFKASRSRLTQALTQGDAEDVFGSGQAKTAVTTTLTLLLTVAIARMM